MNNPNHAAQILLATYNGAEYLPEQIASIQAQTHHHWRLLVRDDGSTDATVSIVRKFAAADRRIELLDDGRGNLGVVGNFAALADAALKQPARYVAFCDQDDVWQPQKLAWQLERMAAAEREAGENTPIAVHSDLAVVDRQLRPVHPSFLRYQGLWHESEHPLRTLVVQNFVTGCTLLVNRPLLELAVPLPSQALVHDWWLALVAASAGRLEFLPQATVLYRQHGGNTIGARRWFAPRVWPKLKQLATRGQSLRESIEQTAALHARLREHPPRPAQPLLERYGAICHHEHNLLRRAWNVNRLGIRRQGRLRNLILLAQWGLLPRGASSLPETRRPA